MHLLLTPCHFECCFGAKGQSSSPVQQCSPVVKSGDCKHISSFYFSEGIAKSLYSSKNRLGCREQSTIVLFELKHSFIILCVLYQILHFLFVHLLVRGKQLFIVLHGQFVWVFCVYRSNCTAPHKGYSAPSLCLLHRQQGVIGTGSPWHYQRVQQYSGGLGKLC